MVDNVYLEDELKADGIYKIPDVMFRDVDAKNKNYRV